jgi:hypothetical protein
VTDYDASSHLSHSPPTLRHYASFSKLRPCRNGGKATGDEHKREAGLLSGEAALNGLFVSTGIATGRERPPVNAFQGKFWQGGDSFPSSHATTAWAIASVISHEYPGPLTKTEERNSFAPNHLLAPNPQALTGGQRRLHAQLVPHKIFRFVSPLSKAQRVSYQFVLHSTRTSLRDPRDR